MRAFFNMLIGKSENRLISAFISTAVVRIIGAIWLGALISTCLLAIYSFSWATLVWNVLFASLITVLCMLFYREFTHRVAGRVKYHIQLFKKNPNPMWVYDMATMRFLSVNEAATALYGYTEAEFLALTIKDIRPAEDVPSLITAAEKRKLDFNHQYHWSGTWRHKTKDGRTIYVEISSHDIIFENKKAQLVLAYNVTDKVLQQRDLQLLNQELEWKVMERTNDLLQLNKRLINHNRIIKSANLELFTISNDLRVANEKIKEHADLKSRFVSMASHEFRIPLANISCAAADIRDVTGSEASEVLTKVKTIEKQVAHMVSLLDDVLTIGKDEAVKLKVNAQSIDVEPFVTGMVEDVRNAHGSSHRICVTMHEATPRSIHADEKFLRNIFINLLNNAIKYSPLSDEVYLNIYPSANAICFEVRDQGLGIESHDIEKIFEPFFRSSSIQNISGTGLGLSIVKRAADLLHARIDVKSEIGKGSVFTVSLPVDQG